MQRVIHGDCLAVMRDMPAESVHAIVTDPPYGLSFMGRRWDYELPDIAIWRECLRVLKPGGHMLAMGGSRTFHRLAVAIEDAGFELRETLMFLYGTGFPKAHNVSKAIDKRLGAKRQVVGTRQAPGLAKTNVEQGQQARSKLEFAEYSHTPITPEAQQWQGWGTALKPAYETIIMARKPLIGTVAANVLEHGVGGLHIDGCRVGTHGGGTQCNRRDQDGNCLGHPDRGGTALGVTYHAQADGAQKGRYPANILHDGSDDVLDAFGRFGQSKSKAGTVTRHRWGGVTTGPAHGGVQGGFNLGSHTFENYGDEGTAARYFTVCPPDDELRFHYSGKASKTDRAGSRHPTCKPLSLMRWLCRLICPPGGIVLDPFAGSGGVGAAAHELGMNAILIERETEYFHDCVRRLRAAHAEPECIRDGVPIDAPLV